MIRSALTGMLLALLVGIFVVLAGTQYGVMVYVAPGALITRIISPVVSSTALDWLVPGGDIVASFGITIVTCTLLFWSALFGLIHYVRRQRRKQGQVTGNVDPTGNE